ncbi:hypothetical protein ElyMa_001659000 [Elysia marginata]|uniref:Uncharacterized protein n=1 Tax=Elysia marginata TaxID=1093978 RepID=A0AAV4JS98_9GAST|nr:hypothetical protein ElyMa_001659000 [Elysia marginata]
MRGVNNGLHVADHTLAETMELSESPPDVDDQDRAHLHRDSGNSAEPLTAVMAGSGLMSKTQDKKGVGSFSSSGALLSDMTTDTRPERKVIPNQNPVNSSVDVAGTAVTLSADTVSTAVPKTSDREAFAHSDTKDSSLLGRRTSDFTSSEGDRLDTLQAAIHSNTNIVSDLTTCDLLKTSSTNVDISDSVTGVTDKSVTENVKSSEPTSPSVLNNDSISDLAYDVKSVLPGESFSEHDKVSDSTADGDSNTGEKNAFFHKAASDEDSPLLRNSSLQDMEFSDPLHVGKIDTASDFSHSFTRDREDSIDEAAEEANPDFLTDFKLSGNDGQLDTAHDIPSDSLVIDNDSVTVPEIFASNNHKNPSNLDNRTVPDAEFDSYERPSCSADKVVYSNTAGVSGVRIYVAESDLCADNVSTLV